VPAKLFDNYFFRAYELLRPGGQFFHHAIVRSLSVAERPGRSFMERYVFPDHFLPTIGHTVTSAEAAGFEARDVKSCASTTGLRSNIGCTGSKRRNGTSSG
jgi:cyclopropane-fatty-acyl-phospholipid synthase